MIKRWRAWLQDAWQHADTKQKIWALAIPMILSNLSVPLVALVDSAVVGRLPHAYQLGAVAVGGTIYTLLVWVFGFLRMGSTGFAAQAAGRKDQCGLQQVLIQGLLLAGLLAVLLIALAEPIFALALTLMQPSEELHQVAQQYFFIRLWGLPAALATHALAGWFLGAQNARAAFWMLVICNLLNIVLDVWFVFGLHWQVAGAARASVIAEWSGVGLGLFLAARVAGKIKWQQILPRLKVWQSWQALLSVNRDILIRSLALQGVFFMVTVQGTRLGDATVAANALLLNGLMICSYALDGLAHALEALTGHALGAKDRIALRRALLLVLLYSLAASLIFAVLFSLFGHYFIALQTDQTAVQAAAQPYLIYLAVLPLVAVWSYVLDGLFIGATQARAMRNAMLLAVLTCLPVAWLLQRFENHGLWLAFLLFMLLRSVYLVAPAQQLFRRISD
ncbi:XRE family transcriptional regulator [Thiopseudomonas alkaliphila]|uniref:MATE family efflux transporter n=1 Tax=Thiopseudomonas alkaliphila TaxID=1697053 RepID=UPI00069E7637|nr:MATE family efflux transporter [Thiopseudomonas alkaliphila]AKX44723.1 XRE family transcriptional regulator [Thiopseudomonas alkaliphila]AKX47694.1 XRE family transcriptional regulator [Thiopseudomonas alkaliphila]AKX48094.1 XRE family transcriptional regulator [Thiopseudomonas alkaliphila]